MKRYKELSGQKFGKLTVLSYAGSNKHKNALWNCQCDCGNQTIVAGTLLLKGNTKSCGCNKKEAAKRATLGRQNLHGLSRDENGKKTRLFRIWTGIKTRCLNSNDHAYPRYGGRGIEICKDWMDFENFHNWAISNGYRNNLSIERDDVDGDYEPSNCKWISLSKQAKNRTNTFYVTYEGETKTLKEWSEIIGIAYETLHARLKKYKWSVEKSFNTPSNRRK